MEDGEEEEKARVGAKEEVEEERRRIQEVFLERFWRTWSRLRMRRSAVGSGVLSLWVAGSTSAAASRPSGSAKAVESPFQRTRRTIETL